MVKHTLVSLGPRVLASRMLHDYVHDLYAPAAASGRSMTADGYSGAREVAAWKARVAKAWPGVSIEHVESSGAGESPHLGTRLTVRATVELGELEPGDVAVELAYGRVDEYDVLIEPRYLELTGQDLTEDGLLRYVGEIPLDRTGAFGYGVRVVPRHDRLTTRTELGLVALPPAPIGMTTGPLR
jgi:starch phosphorylase